MRARLTAVVAIVALSSVPAFAETLQMFKEIQKQITHYAYFTVFDNVNVGIDEVGVVTLTGSVTNPFKKRAIEKRVGNVDAVFAVDNQIEVLPLSRLDNRLRYQVARAIYGHPSLGQYVRTYPSINIVVKRGHVTLAGAVNTKSDEMIALSQVRRLGAFSVTSELKTSAEAAAELERL